MDRNEILALLSYAQGVGWGDSAHDLAALSRRLTDESGASDETLVDDASRFATAFLASPEGQQYQTLTGFDPTTALVNQTARLGTTAPSSAAVPVLDSEPVPASRPMPPKLTWPEYRLMEEGERARWRAAFHAEFRDRADMRSGEVDPYPLAKDNHLELLVQSARAIGEKYAGSRIFSLGASPQWFVATAQLLDPEPGRFDFIPFSGRWYHPAPGLTGDYVADAEMAPTPVQIGDYRKLLEGLGLHPASIVQRESPTVIVETIQGGASTLSFIEGILFAWAEELGLADSLRAKLRIHCLVPRKWPMEFMMAQHMALVKRAMKNYEALIEHEILPATLVDALGGLSDEYHDRLVPYHNVAQPWRNAQSRKEGWDSGTGLVRFRIMDHLATHHPDLIPPPPPSRTEIERRLLSGDTGEAQGYRERAKIFPALTRWVELGDLSEKISVPAHWVRDRIRERLQGEFLRLRRIYHLKFPDDPSGAEEKAEALWKELGLPGPEPKPEGNDWKTLTAADMDCLDSQEELIGRIRGIAQDLASFPEEGTVRFQISLWNRERPSGLKLPAGLESDLGCQVITVSLPNGRIVDGFVLRLLRYHDELIVALSDPIGGDHDHYSLIEPLRPAVLNIAKEIASRLGIKSSVRFLPSAQVTWRQPPFVPVMAPHGVETALEAIEQKVIHPERDLYAWPRGSYEALRPARKGKIDLKIPWWGSLPEALDAVWGMEIETNPQPEDAEKYLWVFNAGTGRAIEVWLPDGHRTSDGTVWHHLSVIGVGKTSLTSPVFLDSDGLLKWDNAWTRFYWSNYLHWVGAPLGLRTSLAVALFDRADLQTDADSPHGQHAVVAELSREQLRLWDLSPDLELTSRILKRVEKQVAVELGRPEMNHEEYIDWLAVTLGTQFAILQYLKVDHGESLEPPPKIPQLHAGQFTLMGEVRDLEQATFGGKSETRYLRNDFRWSDHLDIERIHELQKRVREARAEGRSLLDDYRGTAGDKDLGAGGLWLAILLEMAPSVDFAATVEEAYRRKLRELEKSGPDPGEARNRFDREKWSSLHLPSPGSPLQTVSSFLKFGALVDVCRLLFLLDRATLLDTEQKKLLPKFHFYAGPSLWTDKMFLLFKVADSLEKIAAHISGQEGLATLAPMLLSLSKSVKGAYETGDQSEYEDEPQEKRRLRFESETLLDEAAPDLRRAADLLLRHLKTGDEAEAGKTGDELSKTESGLRVAIAASWLYQIGETRDRFSVKRSPDFWMALHRLYSRLSQGEAQTAQEVETALEGLRGLLGELPTENQPIVALQLYTPRDLVAGAMDALEQLLTTSAPPSSTPPEPNLPMRSGSPTPSATHAGAEHQMPRGMIFTRTPNAAPQRRGHIRGPVIHLASERGLKKAAAIAARLSDKALAALADRDRLDKVLAKTGYAWAQGGLGPWGRKIPPSDLLLLGLAALARSDREVALVLQKISPHQATTTDVAATKGLPAGLTTTLVARPTPSLVTLGR